MLSRSLPLSDRRQVLIFLALTIGACGSPSTTQQLSIESDPSGALVCVGGDSVGTTPLAMDVDGSEALNIWIERDGYYRWNTYVVAGPELKKFQVKLVPIDPSADEIGPVPESRSHEGFFTSARPNSSIFPLLDDWYERSSAWSLLSDHGALIISSDASPIMVKVPEIDAPDHEMKSLDWFAAPLGPGPCDVIVATDDTTLSITVQIVADSTSFLEVDSRDNRLRELPRLPLPPSVLDMGTYVRLSNNCFTKPEVEIWVPPDYPVSAREAGAEGLVLIDVLVGSTGHVEAARLLQRVHPNLDASALEAGRNCMFDPGEFMGVPIPVWVTLPFKFTLY